MRGDGSVYLRGDVWWMRFYRNGKPYSESAQTTVKTEARTKLRARVQESRSDKFVPPQIDRIRSRRIGRNPQTAPPGGGTLTPAARGLIFE